MSVMSVKVITDSTSYIPESEQEKYDIALVSLSVLLDGESIREMDIPYNEFYERMSRAKTIPTSSQPAVGELTEAFEKVLAAGNDIFGVFISSKMSGTYQTALMIKQQLLEKYPERKIEIMDSGTNCMQLGFIALEAAKAGMNGASMEEVWQAAEQVRTHSRFIFTPEVLDYLQKGGRIARASALLGTLLQIKPVLTVNDGVADVFAKVRTKKKAVEAIVDGMTEEVKGHEIGGVMVHHINCADEGRALADRLEKQFGIKIGIQSIGPIIGVHVGPGAIGVAYWWK